MAVKRATSDPGQRVQLTYQTNTVASGGNNGNSQSQQQVTIASQQQQQQTSVNDGFTMTGYPEDGGYFSPSLQDEVFQQVTSVPDSVLLHASQLDAIQVSFFFFFILFPYEFPFILFLLHFKDLIHFYNFSTKFAYGKSRLE